MNVCSNAAKTHFLSASSKLAVRAGSIISFISWFASTRCQPVTPTRNRSSRLTLKDHAGLVENEFDSRQALRTDSSRGSIGGAGGERRGLLQFDAFSAADLAATSNPGATINIVTVRLITTQFGWGNTTLDFRPLIEVGNGDWIGVLTPGPNYDAKVTNGAPALGGAFGVNQIVDWIAGNGLQTNSSAPVFAPLTSSNADPGGAVFDVSLTGAGLLNRLTRTDDAGRHLLITEQTPGTGAQTRFALLGNT